MSTEGDRTKSWELANVVCNKILSFYDHLNKDLWKFTPISLFTLTFFTLKSWELTRTRYFWTTYPPSLVSVVKEWPLMCFFWDFESFDTPGSASVVCIQHNLDLKQIEEIHPIVNQVSDFIAVLFWQNFSFYDSLPDL